MEDKIEPDSINVIEDLKKRCVILAGKAIKAGYTDAESILATVLTGDYSVDLKEVAFETLKEIPESMRIMNNNLQNIYEDELKRSENLSIK